MISRRRDRGRFPIAVVGSLLLHGALGALAWATASRADVVPPMRVYAVDIVSPPPQALGAFDPEPAAAAAPEPVAPEPVEPEPTPPEPEPSPAPPAKKTPEPAPPKPKPEPAKTQPPKPKQEAPKAKPSSSSGGTSAGTKTTPSTGQNPDPTSEGGEGLDYQLKGVQCPSPQYCNNIIRQVNRFFRSPGGRGAAEAEIYFVIARDGSVSDMRVLRSSGGAPFRLAVLEAVEQAGISKAFGPLPRAFPGDELPVSFYFRPAR